MLQLGFFIFFNLMAFGFLFYGIKQKRGIMTDILFIFSMVLFFMLGFYMLIPEDIGISTNYMDNFGMNITQTDIFIEDRETFYLIYVYWGMALASFIAFMFARLKM